METQQKALPLRAAYTFGVTNGFEKETTAIKEMVIEWDRSYTSSLRRGFIVDLFQGRGCFDRFKSECWPFGDTPQGEGKRRFYLRLKKEYEDFLAGRGPDLETSEETVEEEQSFAAEADLRDFLAKNPGCIESGLALYKAGDRSGIEFAIDDGRIDLLAVDRQQQLVVIELKVGRGRNKTIGQLLYYMGWVDKNLAKGKTCRGIIIAKDISEDLVVAVQRVPGVTLCRYSLSVTVEAVAATPKT